MATLPAKTSDSESSCSDTLELTCISKRHIKKVKHTWVIEDFMARLDAASETTNETVDDIVKSDPFFIPIKVARGEERRLKFQMEMNLKNDMEENKSHVSYFIQTFTPDPPFRMKYEVNIKTTSEDLDLKTYYQMADTRTFGGSHSKRWGCQKAYNKAILKRNASVITKNDALTLETVMQVVCQHSQGDSLAIPTNLVQGYLGKRLWDGRNKTGDVKLICGETSIPAHRNVLMVSSDVLGAMFHHQTAESETGLIHIRDMSPSGSRTTGPRTTGPRDYWSQETTGPRDYWSQGTTGPKRLLVPIIGPNNGSQLNQKRSANALPVVYYLKYYQLRYVRTVLQ